MLLVVSVSFFVISIITALVMLIVGKNMNRSFLFILTALHILVLLIAIYFYPETIRQPESFDKAHLSLLLTLCSGLILFGAWMRQEKHSFIKLYFGFYLLSLVFFIKSPGRFFGFIYSGDHSELKEISYLIDGPYYLSKQNSSSSKNSAMYKVYMKKGLLTYTLVSGLEINGSIESISNFSQDTDSIRFMIYYKNALTLDSISWSAPSRPRGKIEIQKGNP